MSVTSKSKKKKVSGSVYFDKSRNKWCAAVSVPYGKRRMKRFSTKEEAELWLKNTDISIGKMVPGSEFVTLGDWLCYYMKHFLKNRVRPSTYATYKTYMKILLPLFRLPLSNRANGLIVQDFFDTKVHMSHSASRAVFIFLNAALKKAVAFSFLDMNWLAPLSLPRISSSPKPSRFFTDSEVLQVEKVIQNLRVTPRRKNQLFLAIYLGLYCGLRMSEVLSLEYSDFDFKKKTVYVHKALVRSSDYKLYVQPFPKTFTSIRIVPCPDRVLYYASLCIPPEGKSFIFYSSHSSCPVVANSSMYVLFEKIFKRAGLSGKTFHCFRHTFASRLLASGVDIATVSSAMGHASINVTASFYLHKLERGNKVLNDTIRNLANEDVERLHKVSEPVR